MNITLKTLSALTIAAAALTATVMSSSAASFTINPQPTQTTTPPPAPTAGSNLIGKILHGGPYKCLVCQVQNPPKPTDGDHDHDHDHDHDRDHGWYPGHGGYGGPIIVEAPPATVIAAPPVRVSAPAPAPSYPVRVAAPQPQAEPCNCLTKQSLPDGSVLFQDICTKESALAPAPQPVGAR